VYITGHMACRLNVMMKAYMLEMTALYALRGPVVLCALRAWVLMGVCLVVVSANRAGNLAFFSVNWVVYLSPVSANRAVYVLSTANRTVDLWISAVRSVYVSRISANTNVLLID
jgi:hypothetical protein